VTTLRHTLGASHRAVVRGLLLRSVVFNHIHGYPRWHVNCNLPDVAQASPANLALKHLQAILEARVTELERGCLPFCRRVWWSRKLVISDLARAGQRTSAQWRRERGMRRQPRIGQWIWASIVWGTFAGASRSFRRAIALETRHDLSHDARLGVL
jgi:hypothetical protein